MSACFVPQLVDQALNVTAAAVLEDLNQLSHGGAMGSSSLEVLQPVQRADDFPDLGGGSTG